MLEQTREFILAYGQMLRRVLRRGQSVIAAWAVVSVVIFVLLRILLGDKPPSGDVLTTLMHQWFIARPSPHQLVAMIVAVLALSFVRGGLSGPLIVHVLGKKLQPKTPWLALKMGVRAAPRAAVAELGVMAVIMAVSSVALLLDVSLRLFVELAAASSLAMVPFLAARTKLRRAFWIGTRLGRRYWSPIFAMMVMLIVLSSALTAALAYTGAGYTSASESLRAWSALLGYEFVSWLSLQTLFLTILGRAHKRGEDCTLGEEPVELN